MGRKTHAQAKLEGARRGMEIGLDTAREILAALAGRYEGKGRYLEYSCLLRAANDIGRACQMVGDAFDGQQMQAELANAE